MKYTEAIKIAKQNPTVNAEIESFRKAILDPSNPIVNGSVQFSIDGECFYYGGEAMMNLETGKWEFAFRGGKHTDWRARQLMSRGETTVIR